MPSLETTTLLALAVAAAIAAAQADTTCTSTSWTRSTKDEPVPFDSFEVQGDAFGDGAGYVCSCDSNIPNVGGLFNSSYVGWICVGSYGSQGSNLVCGQGDYYVLDDQAGLEWKNTTSDKPEPWLTVVGPKETGSDKIGLCSFEGTNVVDDSKLVSGVITGDRCWVAAPYSNFGRVGGNRKAGEYAALVC